jgi:two-component system copper resistance phosphate regulon response regulator CusR
MLYAVKILVVEDDSRLAAVLRRGLAESGHLVDVEQDGLRAQSVAIGGAYDAIVLDIMLPGRDGLSVVREMRKREVGTPVLLLSSRDTVDDTIAGLDAGADDYLRKPFVFRELDARLRSITRRGDAPPQKELRRGDLRLDQASRRVFRGDVPLQLTARETAFVEYFMLNAGLLLTRPMIEDALWEPGRDTESNIIEVYVRRLRSKLSPNGEPNLIHTIRGAGYRFGDVMRHP